MKSVLSISLVLTCATLWTAHSFPHAGLRIIGGRDAKPHEFPYILSLNLHGSDGTAVHRCGGCILNERWILTAAHCFDHIEGFIEVRAGAHYLNETMKGEQTSLVSRTIIHPDYDAPNYDQKDIALVELETPFTFSETVQPIALPPQDEIALATPAITSGWGAIFGKNTKRIHPNTLQTVIVSVLTNAQCQEIINSYGSIKNHEFCTLGGGIGTCSGDSGGPLVQNNNVIGVVSKGFDPCGENPSVYERVSYHIYRYKIK